jgi:SAM-dependent methyltransferase
VKCGRCGLLYLNPRPKADEISRIYPPNYYSFDTAQKGLAQKCLFFFLDRVRILRAKTTVRKSGFNGHRSLKIMDIGCGNGERLAYFRQRNPGIKLFGVEQDPNACGIARQRGIKTYQGMFENMDISEDGFDIVLCNHLIEHTPHPNVLLEKIFSLLGENGCLVLETPNVDAIDYYLFRRHYWGGYHFPRHLILFDDRTLTMMLARNGFRVNSCEYVPSHNFWIWSIHNLLLDRFRNKVSIDRIVSEKNPAFFSLSVVLDAAVRIFYKTSIIRVFCIKRR